MVLWRPGLRPFTCRKHSGSSWSEKEELETLGIKSSNHSLVGIFMDEFIDVYWKIFGTLIYSPVSIPVDALVVFQETVASSSAPAQATANGVMLYVAALII